MASAMLLKLRSDRDSRAIAGTEDYKANAATSQKTANFRASNVIGPFLILVKENQSSHSEGPVLGVKSERAWRKRSRTSADMVLYSRN
jgi:hypothetical protein